MDRGRKGRSLASSSMTGGDAPGAPPEKTVGGFDRAGRRWVLGLFAVGGAALGALLPPLASWVVDLPWVPFQGPLSLLRSFDEPWLVWGWPASGLVGGLGFAIWVIVESPILDINHEQIQVRRRGQIVRVIERTKVAAVYPCGSKIVIETDSGRKLFEGDVEGDKSIVRSAFVDNGYPWEGPATDRCVFAHRPDPDTAKRMAV